jgi:hypothetical protein
MDGLEHFVSVQLVKNKQKQANIKTSVELLLFLPLLSSFITWIEYNYFLKSHGRKRGDATFIILACTLRCTNRIDNSHLYCLNSQSLKRPLSSSSSLAQGKATTSENNDNDICDKKEIHSSVIMKMLHHLSN